MAGGTALQRAHHVFCLSASDTWLLNQRCQVALHHRRELQTQRVFERAETLLSLRGQRGLRQPLNDALHAVAVQSLQRAPAQAGLPEQMLYGFIEILPGGKARVVRGDRPYQTRQGRFFRRLRLPDPVH